MANKLITTGNIQPLLTDVAEKINDINEQLHEPQTVNIEYPNNTASICIDATGTKYNMIESSENTIELNGRTLVNLWGNKTEDFLFQGGNAVFANGWITINGNGKYIKACPKKAHMFKPSTEYTLIINVKENTLNGKTAVLADASGSETTVFPNTIWIDAAFVGTVIYKVTSKAEIDDVKFVTRTQITSTSTEGSITLRMIILEGDYTNVPVEYFEGLKSAGETEGIEVKSTGKNLFDFNKWITNASFTNVTNKEKTFIGTANSFSYAVSESTNLKPNTMYTLSFSATTSNTNSDNYPRINIGKQKHIDSSDFGRIILRDGNSSITFNTGNNNEIYLNLYVQLNSNNNNSSITFDYIQIEEGVEATEYEPYKEQIVTFPEIEPLRSLPNGVCDEAFIHDDKLVITRKVGKQVVDNLTRYNTNSADYKYRFYLDNSNCDFDWSNEWLQNNTIGNNYKPNLKAYDGVNGNYAIGSDGVIWICDTNYANIEAFSEYLGTNPFELYHTLKTYLYEWYELPSPHLYKEGNLLIETGAIPLTTNSHEINVSIRSVIDTNVEEIMQIKEELNTLDLEVATQEDVSDMWQELLEGGNN